MSAFVFACNQCIKHSQFIQQPDEKSLTRYHKKLLEAMTVSCTAMVQSCWLMIVC